LPEDQDRALPLREGGRQGDEQNLSVIFLDSFLTPPAPSPGLRQERGWG